MLFSLVPAGVYTGPAAARFSFRYRRKKNIAAATARTTTGMTTPMATLSPVLRPPLSVLAMIVVLGAGQAVSGEPPVVDPVDVELDPVLLEDVAVVVTPIASPFEQLVPPKVAMNSAPALDLYGPGLTEVDGAATENGVSNLEA